MSTSNTQNLYTLQDEIASYVHYTSQQRNLTNTKISSLEKMHRDVVEENMRLRQKVKELQSRQEKMIVLFLQVQPVHIDSCFLVSMKTVANCG